MPHKANRKEAIACDFRVYKDRNRVYRMFNRLAQFRRTAIRYDKTAVSFLSFRGIHRREALDAACVSMA